MACKGFSNKDSCSICLEPFLGRNPKILPCFHTYCVNCLSRLSEKASMEMSEKRKVPVDGRAEVEKEIVIVCPVCCENVKVPSGGVEKFQTNFYLQESQPTNHVQPILCDLCEQGQVASHCCSRCQLKLCFHCHLAHGNCPQAAHPATPPVSVLSRDEVARLLESGRAQMDIICSVLSHAAEEEKELQRQRKIVEDRVHELYSAGHACLTSARDDVLRKIRVHAECREETLRSEMADMQQKSNTLAGFFPKWNSNSIVDTDLQKALMPDSEMRKLQARAEEKTAQFFSLKTSDRSTEALVNNLTDLVFGSLQLTPGTRSRADRDYAGSRSKADSGDAVGSSDAGQDLLGDGTPQSFFQQQQRGQLQNKHTEDETLSARVDDLAQKFEFTLSKVKENESREKRLQVEMKNLMEEMKAIRGKNMLLIHNMAVIQSENEKLKNDVSQMERSQTSHSEDQAGFAKQTTTVSDIAFCAQAGSQKQQNAVSASRAASAKTTPVELLKDVQSFQFEKLLKDVQYLKDEQRNAAGRNVAQFQKLESMIAKAVKLVYFQATLDRKVTTNRERPLICKDVRRNKGDGYNSQSGRFFAPVSGTYLFLVTVAPHHDDKMAQLDIMQGELDSIGFVCSNSINTSSSAYCIVQLEVGESVWLRTLAASSSFDKDGMTTFSGILLKPQLDNDDSSSSSRAQAVKPCGFFKSKQIN